MTTLRIYSNRHIKNEVYNIEKGDWVFLENSLSRKRWSLYFRTANINESKLRLTYIDFEEFMSLKKKFDAIIGNPPYQDAGGQNTLYPHFYNKSLECLKDGGTLELITPTAIIPGLWGLKKVDGITMHKPRKIKYIKTGDCVKSMFPGVGSTFCYFVIENTDSDNTSVTVETDNGITVADGPLLVTKETKNAKVAQSILNKCFDFGADPYSVSTSDYGRSAQADPSGKDLAVESISTSGKLSTRKITYVRDHPHYNKPKVIMPLYGKTAVVDYSHKLVSAAQERRGDGIRLKGHNIATVITESDEESENLINDVLGSSLQKVFNYLINETRAPYMSFLKNFKGVPLNRRWTDQQLYDHFGLSPEERQYIKDAIK